MARSGVWYTHNIVVEDSVIEAPKNFRRCTGVTLRNVSLPNAAETLWTCEGVKLENVTARGDYFAMNSGNIEVDGLVLAGNYSFDGAHDVHVTNSRLLSKDAFWNTENVLVENSYIAGEYLGWNARNIKFCETAPSRASRAFAISTALPWRTASCSTRHLPLEYSSVERRRPGPYRERF